jgi:ribosome-associated toxin RatA of RatAB toxin-antitoxin module
VRDRDGIAVYTRPVEGSGIREFKGSALVSASAERIRSLLRDADHFKDWFPNTSESRLLAREGDVSYQYSVLDAPWPVSDRDNVFRSETAIDPTSGEVAIRVSAAPDYHPEQPERVRVRRALGLWLLEPLGEAQTRVTFTMHLEPGGGVPQWLINAQVVETPFDALTNLRTAVSRR